MTSGGSGLVEIGNGLIRFFSEGAAEPGLMIVLAAATVMMQVVRRYRAAENIRTRMIRPAMLSGMAAAAEG
jgi:hypothetical protein